MSSTMAIPEKIIHRPKLYEVYDAASARKAVCVEAPAGFGKTLSTALWIKRSKRSAVWVTPSSYDNAPAIFFRRLLSAFRDGYPEQEASIDARAFDVAPVEHTLKFLLSLPSAREEKSSVNTLVIDDIHVIWNEEIINSLHLVIDALPASFAALFLGRNSFATRSVKKTIKGLARISPDALIFSSEDVLLSFESHGHYISESEARSVFDSTGGWPIASTLAAAAGIARTEDFRGEAAECMKNAVWDRLDSAAQKFLLTVCVIDEMEPEVCSRLTGYAPQEVCGVLDGIVSASAGFVQKIDSEGDRYACHTIFLVFLRAISPDTEAACRIASDFYMQKEMWHSAISCALRSNKNENIAPALMRILQYDAMGNSISQHVEKMRNIIRIIPESKYEELPYLYIMLAGFKNLTGDAKGMCAAFDGLYKAMPEITQNYPEFLSSAIFIRLLDHRLPNGNIFRGIISPEILSELRERNSIIPARSKNLPFFHKGGRDVSGFPGLPEDDSDFKETSFLWGNIDETVLAALKAGMWYEKNDLKRALESADRTLASLPDLSVVSPETFFFTSMIGIAVSDAMEHPAEAGRLIDKLKKYLIERGAFFLLPNFMAYVMKMRMTNGDSRIAPVWLDNYYADTPESQELELYKIFQHLTTARALMICKDTEEARPFLTRLIKLASDFGRVIDKTEAAVLLSILEWHRGDCGAAAPLLRDAIAGVQKYRYIRVFADEGAALLPVMDSLLQRARGNAADRNLLSFMKEIRAAAELRSTKRAGIASAFPMKLPKLTKQQRMILDHLGKGCGRSEIAVKTNLAPDTVKFHISGLYRKLNVHSAKDALSKFAEMEALINE
ncbi:MAG: LuxR C-terminal-related transcriptional regulator [Synergistaceae bacterium]|nr:LuxR C-terminal-related transcriptional regulator [Synergistaceae bacterium]